jgi:ribosomal protein S18 acetylase RimI-like enzyme
MNDAFLSRIEDAGLNASAPPEQRWLDGWLLRFSPGKAKRARCVNAVADGRLTLDERLALAEAAYLEHGLPMVVRITPFTRPADLEALLAARGWRRFDDTRVMLRRDLPPPDPARRNLKPQAVSPDEYAGIVGALRGSTETQRSAHAYRMRHAPVRYQGFVVRDGELVVACGQFVREGELAGLYDVFTAIPARGQGIGRMLCSWLLDRAVEQGARHAYLQVDADNVEARAMYHRLGFADAYAYHYRTTAADAAD